MRKEDREGNESIFLRSELLLGRSGMERLKNSSVAVFGLGGVGGHCAEALARSGVGRLILVDSDRVSETNLNRQCVAFRSTIGQMKTKVMEQIIKEICPDTEVMTFETFVLPDNVERIFEKAGPVDYIVDAIDTVTAKLALADWAAEHGVSMISSMGTGNKLHPERFRLADIEDTAVCPLCRVMRRELKNGGFGAFGFCIRRKRLCSRIRCWSRRFWLRSRRLGPGGVPFPAASPSSRRQPGL